MQKNAFAKVWELMKNNMIRELGTLEIMNVIYFKKVADAYTSTTLLLQKPFFKEGLPEG